MGLYDRGRNWGLKIQSILSQRSENIELTEKWAIYVKILLGPETGEEVQELKLLNFDPRKPRKVNLVRR